jgi:hypothetical protein
MKAIETLLKITSLGIVPMMEKLFSYSKSLPTSSNESGTPSTITKYYFKDVEVSKEIYDALELWQKQILEIFQWKVVSQHDFGLLLMGHGGIGAFKWIVEHNTPMYNNYVYLKNNGYDMYEGISEHSQSPFQSTGFKLAIKVLPYVLMAI